MENKENTWCRKPDCKYHPDVKMHVVMHSWKRCITCKYFVTKDNYVAAVK